MRWLRGPPASRLMGLLASRLTRLLASRLTRLLASRLTRLLAPRLTRLLASRLTGLLASRLTGLRRDVTCPLGHGTRLAGIGLRARWMINRGTCRSSLIRRGPRLRAHWYSAIRVLRSQVGLYWRRGWPVVALFWCVVEVMVGKVGYGCFSFVKERRPCSVPIVGLLRRVGAMVAV